MEANILLLRITGLALTDQQMAEPIDLMLRLLQASSWHRGMTTESFDIVTTTLEGSIYALTKGESTSKLVSDLR